MRIIRTDSRAEPDCHGAVAALGNFDGVHLGHISVIEAARAEAARLSAPLGIVTFEPHPRSFFSPDAPPFRLMNREARAHRLQMLGVEILFELTFDARMAGRSAENFAREVLHEGLGLRHAVVGADFRFGKGRQGDAAMLQALGQAEGFGVTIAPILHREGLEISSTAIRRALSAGDTRAAAAMLGHWHRIEGPVRQGDRRGRDLGFPTANLSLEGLHLPRYGIYAVLADILDGPHAGHHLGVASLGTRPTFGDNPPNLEVYIFDFAGDIYGCHLSVALVEFIRPELQFDSVEALVARMRQDCEAARGILAELPSH
ncbi:MAG: bifunctional riboflavin kinase/FAD synthetase [Alphaproteobacteria bacterium]|nr:MAG: bifunctional riboflavin kinase/FAD synthetase [Alphaproteobacteria bacterium]